MKEQIELPFHPNQLGDLTEEQKNELLMESIKASGAILLTAMLAIKAPNFIRGSFEDGLGNSYELLLLRKKGAAQGN